MSMSIQGAFAAPVQNSRSHDGTSSDAVDRFNAVEPQTTGLGHVISGGLGALTVGMLSGSLGAMAMRVGRHPLVGLAIGLGGAAAGALAGNYLYRSREEMDARQEVMRRNADRLDLSTYDRNADLELDLSPSGGARETTYVTTIGDAERGIQVRVDSTELLSEADRAGDGDGVLTNEEFVRWARTGSDPDRDGKISWDELERFSAEHPSTISGM